jgi:hypothetical protein
MQSRSASKVGSHPARKASAAVWLQPDSHSAWAAGCVPGQFSWTMRIQAEAHVGGEVVPSLAIFPEQPTTASARADAAAFRCIELMSWEG